MVAVVMIGMMIPNISAQDFSDKTSEPSFFSNIFQFFDSWFPENNSKSNLKSTDTSSNISAEEEKNTDLTEWHKIMEERAEAKSAAQARADAAAQARADAAAESVSTKTISRSDTPADDTCAMWPNMSDHPICSKDAAVKVPAQKAIGVTDTPTAKDAFREWQAVSNPTTRDYDSSAYKTLQAPVTNYESRDYDSSAYKTLQAPVTNYGSPEQYVPPQLDFKPIPIPEFKYQFNDAGEKVTIDRKLDIPNFKPNPIPKSMPIPPSINPIKQFDNYNSGRDIVLSRENPGIPSSAWNP
jgi:hypothetical protein